MIKHPNGLRRFIDKIKPNFVEGGKFAWLQSTFEAFETFAFTPNRVTKRGCHVRDAIDLKRAMITVVIALAPAMLLVCGTLAIKPHCIRQIGLLSWVL